MGSEKTYSPSDSWPRHSLPRIKELFDVAREYGWTLKYLTNHKTYLLQCPGVEEQCSFRVFSTGKAQESFAKSAIKKVYRCSHNSVVNAGLATAKRHMDNADKLLDSIDIFRTSNKYLNEVMDVSEQEAVPGGEVQELLEAAAALEREAVSNLSSLLDQPDEENAMGKAASLNEEARGEIGRFDRSNSDVKEAWSRCLKIGERIQHLRNESD